MSNRAVSEALGLCIATRTPVLLWGDPGTGKTSMVRDVVKQIRSHLGLSPSQFAFETIIASLHEPSDFGGLPVVVGDESRFIPPAWARRVAAAGDGAVFFDEISTAAPAVQAALLRVVFEGIVGDLVLPEGVIFLAAANPPATSAGGWELSAPLANRFVHLDWLPEAQEVCAGLLAGFKVVDIPVLPSPCPPLPEVAAGVTGFIAARPSTMLSVPASPAEASRGWPSPRSWETVITLLSAASRCGTAPEVKAMLLAGTVGAAVAHELSIYLDALDLPNPEDVLANPEAFVLPGRGDKRYAILASVAAAVAGNPTPERWIAGWKVLGVAADQGAVDVATVAARVLTDCAPRGVRAPAEIAKFFPVMQMSGLLDGVSRPAARIA